MIGDSYTTAADWLPGYRVALLRPLTYNKSDAEPHKRASDGSHLHRGMPTDRTQHANVQSAKDPTHNPKLDATAVTVTD